MAPYSREFVLSSVVFDEFLNGFSVFLGNIARLNFVLKPLVFVFYYGPFIV